MKQMAHAKLKSDSYRATGLMKKELLSYDTKETREISLKRSDHAVASCVNHLERLHAVCNSAVSVCRRPECSEGDQLHLTGRYQIQAKGLLQGKMISLIDIKKYIKMPVLTVAMIIRSVWGF